MKGTCDFPAHAMWRPRVHSNTQCGHRKEGASVTLSFDVILHTATVYMLYIDCLHNQKKVLPIFCLENKTNRNEKKIKKEKRKKQSQ